MENLEWPCLAGGQPAIPKGFLGSICNWDIHLGYFMG